MFWNGIDVGQESKDTKLEKVGRLTLWSEVAFGDGVWGRIWDNSTTVYTWNENA
jgi:hypothetical protein